MDELEAALKAAGKTYEFHRYDGAGHAFFSVERPAFRPEAAVDGWQRIFELVRPLPGGGLTMCSYLTVATEIAGSAKGPQGWFACHVGQRLLRPPVPRAVRPHAQHRLRRPVPWPGRTGRRRAQRGVGAAPRREHQRGARRSGGRRHVTTPTGPAAGVHLPWAEVPGAVQTWAAEVGGGAPRSRCDKWPAGSRRAPPLCSTVPPAPSSSRRSGPP